MSLLGNILGINVGQVLSDGIGAAAQVITSNNALQVAQFNLQAQAQQTERAVAAASANTDLVRLLITVGFVGGGIILATRLLRK